jgi:tetratricopeptide (TPR) repeat protein
MNVRIRLGVAIFIIAWAVMAISCARNTLQNQDNSISCERVVKTAKTDAEEEKIVEEWDKEVREGTAAEERGQYVQALFHYEKALEYVERYEIDEEGGTEYSIWRLFLNIVCEKRDLSPLFSILEAIGPIKGFDNSRNSLLSVVEDYAGVSFCDRTPETEAQWAQVINSALAWWQTNKGNLAWDEETKKFVIRPKR